MEDYQQQFIEFLVEEGALRFGAFTLKSGRESPYFFNTGCFDDANAMRRLGYFYACAIRRIDPQPTLLFGPAYKGIPLCISAAIALHEHFKINLAYCFDRKETKAHGDKGWMVGRSPEKTDRIAIVDDVITDGATKLAAIKQLSEHTSAAVTSLVIAFNRCEKDRQGNNPIAALEHKAKLSVQSIVNIRDVLEYLRGRSLKGKVFLTDETARKIEDYLKQYGVA